MKQIILILFIILNFNLLAQDAEKKPQKERIESTSEETKIIEKTPRQFYQRSNPPKKTPLPRTYPGKSSGELVEFGWEQFKEENYEHASECFQELVTRKDSLADAYLGLGWSKLMLYRPIEETRIIKSSDYVKNREFYILKPNEFLDLYSEADDCPMGWIDNAIKLDENGDPLHILTRENMPVYDWEPFPIILYIDFGSHIDVNKGLVKGKEINSTSNEIYNFWRSWLIDDYDDISKYDANYCKIEILDELSKQFIGNFNDYVIAVSYLNVKNDEIYIANSIQVSNRSDTRNIMMEYGRTDSSYVKIIKRRSQDYKTDTWDYQVFNLYDFSGDEYRQKEVRIDRYLLNEEEFYLSIYKLEEDDSRNYIVPGTELTFNEYLRIDSNSDGVLNNSDSAINLEENWFRFPFIRPFDTLESESIYEETDNNTFESDMIVELNMRYADYRKYLEINRILVKVNNQEITQNQHESYYAAMSFLMAISKNYHGFNCYFRELKNQKWKLEQNSNIDFRDLVILQSLSFYKQDKLTETLLELQKVEPEFNPDITNQNGIKELHNKIEELIKTIEIVIK